MVGNVNDQDSNFDKYENIEDIALNLQSDNPEDWTCPEGKDHLKYILTKGYAKDNHETIIKDVDVADSNEFVMNILYNCGVSVEEKISVEMEELGINLDLRKNVQVNNQMATNQEKVFATGDAVNGASLVVTAIASGRRVARRMDEFLNSG